MNRRHFLASLGGLAVLGASPALAQVCPPRTDPNIEGPFYRPGAPLRDVLAEPGGLRLTGTVRDTACRPMRDAVLEIWHADTNGEYDLQGDRLRGMLRTDENGRWSLRTGHPGHYRVGGTYRPAHIHVKVHANDRPPLTTQLYFRGDPYNDADPWFRQSLLIHTPPSGCSRRQPASSFHFVV